MTSNDDRSTSDDVKIRKITTCEGKKVTTYRTRRRNSAGQPDDVTKRLAWAAAHCRPVSDLARPEVIRRVLDALATRLDGKQAAGRTTHRKRAVLSNALSFAVENGLLPSNPVGSIKWKAPRSSTAVEA